MNAPEESIQAQLEEMFMQAANRRILQYGVGRTTMTRNGADVQRLDAQRRKCDGSIVLHAARAMELALHVLYARGMDRILGRDYPGANASIGTEVISSMDVGRTETTNVSELTAIPITVIGMGTAPR